MENIDIRDTERADAWGLEAVMEQLDGARLLSSREIMNLRTQTTRKGKKLFPHLSPWPYITGDGVILTCDADQVTMYVTTPEQNPLFKKPLAEREKVGPCTYTLSQEELSDLAEDSQQEGSGVVSFTSTEGINITINAKDEDKEEVWGTRHGYARQPAPEQRIVNAFYGTGDELDRNMEAVRAHAGTTFIAARAEMDELKELCENGPVVTMSQLGGLGRLGYAPGVGSHESGEIILESEKRSGSSRMLAIGLYQRKGE